MSLDFPFLYLEVEVPCGIQDGSLPKSLSIEEVRLDKFVRYTQSFSTEEKKKLKATTGNLDIQVLKGKATDKLKIPYKLGLTREIVSTTISFIYTQK